MKENDIDDLFKKSFENFEAQVKPSIWKNIQVGLKWGGAGLVVKFILNKMGTNTIVAVLSSAATVVSTVMVMNWTNGNNEKTSLDVKNSTESIVPVVKADPVLSVDTKEQIEPVAEVSPIKTTTVPSVENTPEEEKQTKELLPETDPLESVKEDKQKIKSVISSFSGQSIASISASPVGGSVPLIVSLMNTGNGNNNKWMYSDGKKENNSLNPVHVFETPGIYTVTLISTNMEGKTAVDSIQIEVTGNSSISTIPTLFSPNGDGIADVFTFQSKNMVNMKVEIFDKKGVIFYRWLGNGGKWDGKNLKGGKAKEGTYFYFITAEGVDGKKYEQKGAINLAR